MSLYKNIFVLLLIIFLVQFAFPQDFQIGFQIGYHQLKNSDRYLNTIIDGPYNIFDKNYFESGYIFDKESFISKTNTNIGLIIEYKLSELIHPFANFTYLQIISTGECNVQPIFSGGLMDIDTKFKIKSNFYIAQFGTNIVFKIRRIKPFLSLKLLFNNIKNNNVELVDANEDFIKYSHKYTFNSINNFGYGLGFGIKIPLIQNINLITRIDYNNFNSIHSDMKISLINYNYAIGFNFQI